MSEYDGHTPSLSQAITKGADRKLDVFWAALPCKVKAIRTDIPGSVDLISLIQVLDDAGNPKALSVIPCVPVAILKSGPFVFSIPTVVGTTGTARIYSRAITQWLVSGSEDAIPEGKRKGNRTDAIFVPDIQPYTSRPEAEQSERLVLGLDSGRVGITIDTSGTVYAGAEATANGPVALSVPVSADFTSLQGELSAIQFAITTLGGTYNPTFTPSNNAANKLKAE